MSKTLDERFNEWEAAESLEEPFDSTWREDLRAAFLAGAVAERESVLEIIRGMQPQNPHFSIEVMRRIRQREGGE